MLVDANILLYAEDSSSPHHKAMCAWWDAALSGAGPVCLTWMVLTAFIRISTNARVFAHPLSLAGASARVSDWLVQPSTRLVAPTASHWQIFQALLSDGQASGNLVMDAHLAAIVIEHGCDLYSTDHDFSRFPKLTWKNPLARKI